MVPSYTPRWRVKRQRGCLRTYELAKGGPVVTRSGVSTCALSTYLVQDARATINDQRTRGKGESAQVEGNRLWGANSSTFGVQNSGFDMRE